MISARGVTRAAVVAMVLLVGALAAGVLGQAADAAVIPWWWFAVEEGEGGDMTVYGTYEGVTVTPPLQGPMPVQPGGTVGGQTPFWATDLRAEVLQHRQDGDWIVTIDFDLPEWDPVDRGWLMVHMEPWQRERIKTHEDRLILPWLYDELNGFRELYVRVDLNAWYANPQPLKDFYLVTGGLCADLPGYLIATTPITYDPSAGQGEHPYLMGQPLTGGLGRMGNLTLTPEPATLSLLALGGAALVARRKRN